MAFFWRWSAAIPLQVYASIYLRYHGTPKAAIEIVPVLIGAFRHSADHSKCSKTSTQPLSLISSSECSLPGATFGRNLKHLVRSALIGVGIGGRAGHRRRYRSPGYPMARPKKPQSNPGKIRHGFRRRDPSASETANNACIGGAMIPLLSMGIPGSPRSGECCWALLLLHGVAPGPMLEIEKAWLHDWHFGDSSSCFIRDVGRRHAFGETGSQSCLGCRQPSLMPVVAVLCLIGSYSLGLKVFNLYLMIPMGILTYYLTDMGYPIPAARHWRHSRNHG